MFTTPQLAALGIGYTGWWRMYTDPSWGNGFHPIRQELTSVEDITYPTAWVTRYGSSPALDIQAHGRVQFYKIGNIQNTGGVRIPKSINTNLMRFYVTQNTNPAQVFASRQYGWSSSTFVSKVRACTPLVEQTVHFGNIIPNSTPDPGTVLSHGDFTLTFTCPYLAYTRIGYSFVPKYTPNISPTVMALEPGAGRAKGVGIRIQRCNGGLCNQTVTLNETYYMSNFNIPVWDQVNQSALTQERTQTINFRAELVRAGPEPFTPGSVKSVVWIYIKYK